MEIMNHLLARQMIHMKCQALFSLEKKKKYFKMSSAAAIIGALSVKVVIKDYGWKLKWVSGIILAQNVVG